MFKSQILSCMKMIMSFHQREGGHIVLGEDPVGGDDFLSARNLINKRVDCNLICLDITLGYDENLIRQKKK